MKPEIRSTILQGDCLDVLKTLDDNSIDCIVTSPPYYGLRDYGTGEWIGGDPNCPHYRTSKYSKDTATGHKSMMEQGEAVGDAIYKTVCPLCGAVRVDKQIGLEETPEEYIEKLVFVFRECKRVLKDDGTLWVNIGDSYNSAKTGSVKTKKQLTNMGSVDNTHTKKLVSTCKPKDMIGIPWMLAFALRDDGWYLRQDIIWHKPNPMPESVRDRCTKAHEYLFLLSKEPHYYFDYEAIEEEATGYDGRKDTMLKGSPKYEGGTYLPTQNPNTMSARGHERWKFKNLQDKGQPTHTMHERRADGEKDIVYPVRRKRDVWSVPVKGFKDAHFATFPEALIEPCVLAGCQKGGIVLDPFCGSGTTGIVSVRNGRNFIGIELNTEYAEMSTMRIEKERTKGIRIDLWAKGGDDK
jgi:DNA modification methylase